MKIAFHSYQLGHRGSEICLYKYAKYNEEILGNESIIVSTNSRPTPTLSRFEKRFKTILYPDVWVPDGQNLSLRSTLSKICDDEKVDAFYAIKGGESDGIFPENAKGLAHCIFRMDQPHGDVYAGVCKYISDKHGGIHPYVYHIIEDTKVEGDYRADFGIPKDALVLGRHGGSDTFNLRWTHSEILRALDDRKDLWFVLLGTEPFATHDRIRYLTWTPDFKEIAKFVNTCDAMMHARYDGEIFSLATAEFSMKNKPVITWNGHAPHYDRGHIEVLQEKGLYYRDGNELYFLLKSLDRDFLLNGDWNVYGDLYSPEKIMKQFQEVFLA